LAKYAICMLCSNDSPNLKASIESVSALAQFFEIEIVVTDNLSRDGSQAILEDLLKRGVVGRVIEQRCTRGRGRQLAFESSDGDYVLSHMDCDDVFAAEGIRSLIEGYHSEHDGMMLMTRMSGNAWSNMTIAPRRLISSLGGWRDLNWTEDWDLWARAASKGKYINIPYPYSNPPHKRVKVRTERNRSIVKRTLMRYAKYSDCHKIGRPVFSHDESTSSSQRFVDWVAGLSVTMGRSKLDPVTNPQFEDISCRA